MGNYSILKNSGSILRRANSLEGLTRMAQYKEGKDTAQHENRTVVLGMRDREHPAQVRAWGQDNLES